MSKFKAPAESRNGGSDTEYLVPPPPQPSAQSGSATSNLEELRRISDAFKRIADDFQEMRRQDVKPDHLVRNIHDKTIQATYLLFKAIDLGGLVDIWTPLSRPYVHCEELPSGLLKIIPDPTAPGGARSIPLPDDQLTEMQLRKTWWWAMLGLYRLHKEYFANRAQAIDMEHSNDFFRVFNSDGEPKEGPGESDEDGWLNYYRRRAMAYKDACWLLSELIANRERAARADGVSSKDDGAVAGRNEATAPAVNQPEGAEGEDTNLGLNPGELAERVGLKGTELIRKAAIKAGVKRPDDGNRYYRYQPHALLPIANARVEMNCREAEKAKWTELLAEYGQPPLGAKPQARSKSAPSQLKNRSK